MKKAEKRYRYKRQKSIWEKETDIIGRSKDGD